MAPGWLRKRLAAKARAYASRTGYKRSRGDVDSDRCYSIDSNSEEDRDSSDKGCKRVRRSPRACVPNKKYAMSETTNETTNRQHETKGCQRKRKPKTFASQEPSGKTQRCCDTNSSPSGSTSKESKQARSDLLPLKAVDTNCTLVTAPDGVSQECLMQEDRGLYQARRTHGLLQRPQSQLKGEQGEACQEAVNPCACSRRLCQAYCCTMY